MLHDLQMAREAIEGGWNLAIGEPVVLQNHLALPSSFTSASLKYPVVGGESELLSELRRLHPVGEIVVTNGAKQALAAAFYAYKNFEYDSVYHPAPYWPSYPTLAKMAGLYFRNSPVAEDCILCVTSPNNPDGEQCASRVGGRKNQIWDAVYAHSVYGWDGVVPDHQIAVYSAAKLLGISGARVGWLVTESEALAQKAREFVELTTSGVSIPSQRLVSLALTQVLYCKDDYKRRYQMARAEMLANASSFRRILEPHCEWIKGLPMTGAGMFAWFGVKSLGRFESALRLAKVSLVSGVACGGGEGWYRMNMGQDFEYTEAALNAIKRHL